MEGKKAAFQEELARFVSCYGLYSFFLVRPSADDEIFFCSLGNHPVKEWMTFYGTLVSDCDSWNVCTALYLFLSFLSLKMLTFIYILAADRSKGSRQGTEGGGKQGAGAWNTC